MKTRAFIHAMLVGLLATGIIHTQASASVVDATLTAAATAVDLGPQDGVFDAFTPLNFGSVNNNGFTSFRTAVEFDLSAVPTGAVVNAATLTTFANVNDGPREIALYGYAGDGSISLADFSLGSLVASATVNPVAGLQTVIFDATAFLDTLVAGNATFAGFNLREDPANSVNLGVMGFMELPARLSIGFTVGAVPAPPAIWLFTSGALGLLLAKRLRRRRTVD